MFLSGKWKGSFRQNLFGDNLRAMAIVSCSPCNGKWSVLHLTRGQKVQSRREILNSLQYRLCTALNIPPDRIPNLGFRLEHPCVKFCAVIQLDRIPYFDAWVSDCLKKEDTVLRLARDDQVEKKLLKKTKTDTLCFVREFFWALSSSVL